MTNEGWGKDDRYLNGEPDETSEASESATRTFSDAREIFREPNEPYREGSYPASIGSWPHPETFATPAAELASLSAGRQTVFIGPSGAGKSSVLYAIEHACRIGSRGPGDYEISLSFENIDRSPIDTHTPRNEELSSAARSRLQRLHDALLRDGRMSGTERLEGYRFNVRVSRPSTFWRPRSDTNAVFEVLDSAGGILFPNPVLVPTEFASPQPDAATYVSTPDRNEVVKHAQAARCIVLCVDCSTSARDQNLSHLSGVLSDIISGTREHRLEPPTFFQRLAALFFSNDQPPEDASRTYGGIANNPSNLSVERFLILLTKADVLAERVRCRSGDAGCSAGAIAAAIDPIAQAIRVVGAGHLSQILKLLPPRGQLAVGVTSAGGFHPRSGAPLLTETGSLSGRIESAEDWEPTGLRDAVIFMVRGEAQGTIRQIRREHFYRGAARHVLRTGSQLEERFAVAQLTYQASRTESSGHRGNKEPSARRENQNGQEANET